MKIRINFSKLLRTDEVSLFKWHKDGVILLYNGMYHNLTTDFKIEESLDILDKLLESIDGITPQQLQDIKEVREYLNDINPL